MLRELEKVQEAVDRAAECHAKANESNAALHLSDRVLYSPLTTALINSQESVRRIRDALADPGAFGHMGTDGDNS